jgi:hypothetical protein
MKQFLARGDAATNAGVTLMTGLAGLVLQWLQLPTATLNSQASSRRAATMRRSPCRSSS